MNPNRELGKLIMAAMDVADIAKLADKVEAKLHAPAAMLLRACDISAGRRLMREHDGALKHVIRRMSLTDLKAVSKKWEPYRAPKATQADQQDLIKDLIALASGQREPAPRPARATPVRPAARGRPRVAAE